MENLILIEKVVSIWSFMEQELIKDTQKICTEIIGLMFKYLQIFVPLIKEKLPYYSRTMPNKIQ